MAPLNSLGTWAVRSSGGRRRPKSRCFFIGEGPNTEFWYLSGLSERFGVAASAEFLLNQDRALRWAA